MVSYQLNVTTTPFGNGKVPVRGQPRVSMVVIESAAMSNVRRIHRYEVAQRESEKAEKTNKRGARGDQQVPAASLFSSFLAQLRSFLRSLNIFQPDLAYGF